MKNWTDIGSDVNWCDYGGRWARRAPDGSWYVLVFTNMWDACGESEDLEQYYCDVKRVDLDELPCSEVKRALDSSGLRIVSTAIDTHKRVYQIENEQGDELSNSSEPGDRYSLVLVEACVSYGLGAPLESFSSHKRADSVRARARRFAEQCMRDAKLLETQLERPVNKIGSTAAEYGRGDIDSALQRGPFDTSKNLMRKLHGLPPGES